ncbi:PSMD12 [Symbiodinium natans]|uniref:PSMD12 protein n=1 Tax=Symbiodinium natans TaxID=878477 RepID=A0A812GHZ1_9DINO|nr:PSMD12 [Symbiodinium natans]
MADTLNPLLGSLAKDPKATEDFSKEAEELLARVDGMAQAGRLEEAVEMLLGLEKKTRQASDGLSTSKLVCKICQLYFDAKEWAKLKENIITLPKAPEFFLIMEIPVVATAGAAASAYYYNLDRFKFDAEQRQTCIYQVQSMRLAQWGLFREDVHDVFGLSTTTMDNYILVGALIVTAVMNFIFVGYPAFPLEPRWLLLMWNNCVFACITFGMLCVWLGMHGSIAQRSAKVKILTQAVRPPVPTLKDIQAATRAQENFEAGGGGRFFQPPAFVVPFDTEHESVPQVRSTASEGRTVPLPSSAQQRKAKAKGKKSAAVDWLGDAPYASDEVLRHLENSDNGGPGRSAVMHSHFWMLRRVQRGYCCFDAYARICLLVAAQQMLMVCSYYSLGHFMSKMDHWPVRGQNPGAAWLSLIAGSVSSATLFRLDLFCGARERRLVRLALLLPPLFAGIAIHLAAARTNHGKGGVKPCDQVIPAWLPWSLALLSCVGHMLFILVVLLVASPLIEGSGLPLNFRPTIYLDIFGWHNRHFSAAAVRNSVAAAHKWENPEGVLYESIKRRPDRKCLITAHQEAKRLSNILRQLLRSEVASEMSKEESDDLKQLELTMEDRLQELENQMCLPPGRAPEWDQRAPAWLQSTFLDGTSEEIYWVNCRAGQVSWEMPEVGQIIDMKRLSTSLEELQIRLGYDRDRFQVSTLAEESLPFELMPENPDLESSSSRMPWKCLQLAGISQLAAWVLTILLILFSPKYYDSSLAPREMFDRTALHRVQTDWPHEHFRPSALSCSADGRQLMLGDQFVIYTADLEVLGQRKEESSQSIVGETQAEAPAPLKTVTLKAEMSTSALEMSWSSFGFLPEKRKLLLLNQEGTALEEYSLRSHRHVRRWRLSNTLPFKRLEAIHVAGAEESAQCATEGSGFLDRGWIVFASTDSGQVVTLCPTFRSELHPLDMVISLRRRKAAREVVEVVDSHTGTAKASSLKIISVVPDARTGYLWLLQTNTEGMAEVAAWDPAHYRGEEVGRWVLPSGRWWVSGMCNLGEGQGFLLAAAADTNRESHSSNAELWRFNPSF